MNPRLWAILRTYAPRYGLDPRAVASIAMNESGGRFNAVGDNGTSFGPFQLHRGGAMPSNQTAGWAQSLPGIIYALQLMGHVARGLHGQAAVNAIATRFERPANPAAEVATAMRYYSSPGFARGSAVAGAGGGGSVGGGGAAALARLAALQSINPQFSTPSGATALQTIQQLIAAHQPPAPSAPVQFAASTAPTSDTTLGQLDTIHSGLLGKLG